MDSGSGHTRVAVEAARSLKADLQLRVSDGESKEWQGGRGGKVRVPRCYSSPEADPSQGEWLKVKGGVNESPATGGIWDARSLRDLFHIQQ